VAKSLPIGLGDEQRLTQVLLNLVGNAIKFTDKGEVRVAAKTVNGHFEVSVTDTGPGIPQEHQGRIFVTPVILPLGLARLDTRPTFTGSVPTKKTIGIT
jgi:C4-dicarboxylate-specific signal transduction histidine kinase